MKFKKLLPLILATALPTMPVSAQSELKIEDNLTYRLSLADAAFAKWMEENHVPGLVWGVVCDGQLVHVKAIEIGRASCRERVCT